MTQAQCRACKQEACLLASWLPSKRCETRCALYHPHRVPSFLLSQVVAFDTKKSKKFRMTEPASDVKALEAFAKSVADGTAEPQLKSAPVPENDKDGEVTIVVGNTFEQIVKDPTKVRCSAKPATRNLNSCIWTWYGECRLKCKSLY